MKIKDRYIPCELRAPEDFLKTIQPARHERHACCPLRAGFLAFQPVADNTRGTRVEQVVSSFQKILRGSQLTWYNQVDYVDQGEVNPLPPSDAIRKQKKIF